MSQVNRLQIRRFNNVVSIRKLLMELGTCNETETSVYCPFHEDRFGGHKSGAVRDEPNLFKCYSEDKVYFPYDVLRLLGKKMEDYIDPDKLYVIKEPVKVDSPIPDYIFKAVAKCTMTLSQAAERLRTK